MSTSLELSKGQLQRALPEIELLIASIDAQLLLQQESLREYAGFTSPEDIRRKAVIQKIVQQFERQRSMYFSCRILLKELLPTLQTRNDIAQFSTTFHKLYNRGKSLHHHIKRLFSSLEPSESILNGRRIQVEEYFKTTLE
jgi:hypothetical protein